VDIVRLSDIPAYDNEKLIAQPFIDGSQSNVRVIKLSPGQALPPHRHDSSDLMLFVVEGEGVLQTENGTVAFAAGSLAYLQGDEELRVSNQGQVGLTMLAVLAPPFPPRSKT
jgi:quercetin dioxygenase-like cupin family protein